MEFQWDPKKAKANLRKHRVSFEEATTSFRNPLAAIYEDPDHSVRERRYLMIGLSSSERLLHIAFADGGESIKIINAREVTKKERELYEKEER